jgi:hypothetical protein
LLRKNGTPDHTGAKTIKGHCWKTLLRKNDLGFYFSENGL